MNEVFDNQKHDKQPFIQRWVLVIVGIVFAASLATYMYKFNGPLSKDQGTWGQFGDFLGGVVNPIVGFCTIWLLTVSLRQNQVALKQANEELKLATQALDASKNIQEKTEAALTKQIEIADQTRDMANAIAIWNHLKVKLATMDAKLKSESHKRVKPQLEIDRLLSEFHTTKQMASSLDAILNKEASRLLWRYKSPD